MFTYPFSFLGTGGSLLQASSTLLLNGINQYATIDNSAALGGANEGVVSIWVNLETLAPSGSRMPFISKRLNASFGSWDLGYKVSGNLFYFRVYHSAGSTEVVSVASPVVGSWYQVAGRFDASNVYLFVNGVQVATAALGGTITKSAAEITIGSNTNSAPNEFYDGSIAIPLVYYTYKDDSEMLALGTARQPNDYDKSGMQVGIPLNKGVSSGLEAQNVISANGDAILTGTPLYNGEPITFDSVPQVTGYNTLLLNGGTDYATVADSASLDLTTGLTLSIYANLASLGATGTYKLIDKITGTTGYALEYDETTQKFEAKIYISNTLYTATSTTTPATSTWYHLAGVYDGSNLIIYINGVSEDTTAASGTITANAQVVTIDCNGSVALPMIYDAGLNSTRISEISVAKDPSVYDQTNMVMGLPFNSGSGTPGTDTTGTGNDATLQGSAGYTGEQLDIKQAGAEPATDRLYTSDSSIDKLYELDPDTLLDISSGGVSSPSTAPQGIGGVIGRLYHTDQTADKIYELDLDTLIDISSGGVAAPDLTPTGMGGMDSRLYFSGALADEFWEIDPDTFLALGAGVSAPVINPQGIGGTSTRLFAVTSVNADSYELDPDTLLASNTVSSPNAVPLGMGGISSRLYTCGYSPSRLYEIDPDTLLDISSGGVAGFGTIPQGIGGVK